MGAGWSADRLNPRWVNVVTFLGFGLPLAAYVWLIAHFSVNVIIDDQWSDVSVIGRTWRDPFKWPALWSPHNENRILFPHLVVILLAHTVHFDIQVEEALSGLMLVAAIALLVWAHKRRSPSTPWLYYCPVAILGFSLVQYQDTLWGFQFAWYLVLLALATTIVLLDGERLGWIAFAGAVAAAVVGSYSSVQGLLIWPVGLILLYHRRRSLPLVGAWVGCAAATTAFYYYKFKNHAAGRFSHYTVRHPFVALKFFLFLVGDIVGVRARASHPGISASVVFFGFVLVVLAVVTLLLYGIRRDEHGGRPVGVALIFFGLGFAVVVTQGRAYQGYSSASASRYTLFDLLIPIGMYLALLQRPLRPAPAEGRPVRAPAAPDAETSSASGSERAAPWMDRIGVKSLQVVVIIAIVVQVCIGTPNGLRGAREFRSYQERVLRDLSQGSRIPASELETIDYGGGSEATVRTLIRTAQKYRLSSFAGDSPDRPRTTGTGMSLNARPEPPLASPDGPTTHPGRTGSSH